MHVYRLWRFIPNLKASTFSLYFHTFSFGSYNLNHGVFRDIQGSTVYVVNFLWMSIMPSEDFNRKCPPLKDPFWGEDDWDEIHRIFGSVSWSSQQMTTAAFLVFGFFNETHGWCCMYTPPPPPRKVTWHWKIAILNKKNIFKWLGFHCHVSFCGVWYRKRMLIKHRSKL